MTKVPSERSEGSYRVPPAPAPLSSSHKDGMKIAREDARRFMPNIVRTLAGIALSPDSEAPLHTKMMSAKELVAIAGAIPQATPVPPPPLDESEGNPAAAETLDVPAVFPLPVNSIRPKPTARRGASSTSRPITPIL